MTDLWKVNKDNMIHFFHAENPEEVVIMFYSISEDRYYSKHIFLHFQIKESFETYVVNSIEE